MDDAKAVDGEIQPQPNHYDTIWSSHLHTTEQVDQCKGAHMKVVKHFKYIQNGYGKQSVGGYSLNQYIMTPYGIFLTAFSKNLAPHRYINVGLHPYTYSQHMKEVKYFLYVYN